MLEAAYFRARYCHHPDLARDVLKQMPEGYHNPAIASCAKAALLLEDGRCNAVIQYVTEAFSVSEKWPNTVFTQMCKEWLQDMLTQAEQQVNDQQPIVEGSER